MNVVKQVTDDDIRDAVPCKSFHDWFSMSRQFQFPQKLPPGVFYTDDVAYYDPVQKCFRAAMVGLCDLVALHSVDFPPFQIERIVFHHHDTYISFNTMAEASFYTHANMFELTKIPEFFIYLKPGINVKFINLKWRCYVLDVKSRNTLWTKGIENVTIPIVRDFVRADGKYKKRVMAKL